MLSIRQGDLEQAFIGDIVANPDDNAPRLVYADWLADNGREERGEFIRVQVELARLDRESFDHVLRRWNSEESDARSWELVRRQRELLAAGVISPPISGMAVFLAAPPPAHASRYRQGVAIPRRGFVAEIRCPLADWLEHGKALRLAHPLEGLEITDREPSWWAYTTSRFRWLAAADTGSPGDVPHEIWAVLLSHAAADGIPVEEGVPVYRDERHARDALNRAAFEWAAPRKT